MNAEPDRSDEGEALEDESAGGEPKVLSENEEPTEDAGGDLQAKADENWDKYLRAAAEVENIRKRAARDVENAHRFALERFASELLTVCDSLEMALATEGEVSVESLQEGNEATLKLLASVMQRFGVEEVDPQGEPFDPMLHEAMTVQSSDDVEPGSVMTVFQKGYALNGRLLRPARVVVASETAEKTK